MIVKIDSAGLKETTWREYVFRFAAGGVITAIVGLIAKKWGPGIAGVFLAFPAIFPAGATLVQKHERQRKQEKGLRGEKRGLDAAADDAMGAALGSIGLLAFAVAGWLLFSRFSAVLVVAVATLSWAVVAVSAWVIRKRRNHLRWPGHYRVSSSLSMGSRSGKLKRSPDHR